MKDIFKFLNDFRLVDWKEIKDKRLILKGLSKELNKNDLVNKPSQLGAFILSYSKRHMNNFNKIIDPDLSNNILGYTDTDSLFINGDYHKILEDNNLIGDDLGKLNNDNKGDGLLIYMKILGPKNYLYYYMDKSGKIIIKNKCKEIKQDKLKSKFYYDEKGKAEMEISKKIHSRLTKTEIQKNINMYSIRIVNISREFNKNQYNGKMLIGNNYLPHGYNGKLIN